MANNLLSPEGTLSWPNLFVAKPRSEGSKPVFGCTIIFDKKAQASPEYKAMQQACIKAAKDKFGADVKLSTLMFPFKDASEKKDYDGFEDGMTFISPWSEQRPGIVDANVQDVIDPSSVYAGLTVRASLAPFGWSNSGKKGVSFGLNHLQIVKEGARIDGRISASKAFSKIVTEDTESPF